MLRFWGVLYRRPWLLACAAPVVVAALLFGFDQQSKRRLAKQRRAIAQLEALGAKIELEDADDVGGGWQFERTKWHDVRIPEDAPPSAVAAALRDLPSISGLSLAGTTASDAALEGVDLSELRHFVLADGSLGRQTLERIALAPHLETVWLKRCALGDDDVRCLLAGGALRWLTLRDMPVTGRCFDGVDNRVLHWLELEGCPTDSKLAERLRGFRALTKLSADSTMDAEPDAAAAQEGRHRAEPPSQTSGWKPTLHGHESRGFRGCLEA